MTVKKINFDLCIGCKICAYACPEDVLRFDEIKKKPYIAYPSDCVFCLFCEIFCPVRAIEVELVRGRKVPEVM